MAAPDTRRSPSSTAVADDWHAELSTRLDELAALPVDWNSYGSDPPNAEALARARIALDVLRDLEMRPTSLVATADGGVAIGFRTATRYADVEFYNDGEIAAVTSDRKGDIDAWEVSPEEIAAALRKIRAFVAA